MRNRSWSVNRDRNRIALVKFAGGGGGASVIGSG